jgi:hypothetical protein
LRLLIPNAFADAFAQQSQHRLKRLNPASASMTAKSLAARHDVCGIVRNKKWSRRTYGRPISLD